MNDYRNTSSTASATPNTLKHAIAEVAALRREQSRYVFVCHPRTFDNVLAWIRHEESRRARQASLYDMPPPGGFVLPPLCAWLTESSVLVNGVRIHIDELCPRFAKKWEPPTGGRFWEYTATDEAWARPLGLGRMVDDERTPVFYRVDTQYVDWSSNEFYLQAAADTDQWLRSPYVPSAIGNIIVHVV